MWERNSLYHTLWDCSLCRTFTWTKTYNTLQERENPKQDNRAPLSIYIWHNNKEQHNLIQWPLILQVSCIWNIHLNKGISHWEFKCNCLWNLVEHIGVLALDWSFKTMAHKSKAIYWPHNTVKENCFPICNDKSSAKAEGVSLCCRWWVCIMTQCVCEMNSLMSQLGNVSQNIFETFLIQFLLCSLKCFFP